MGKYTDLHVTARDYACKRAMDDLNNSKIVNVFTCNKTDKINNFLLVLDGKVKYWFTASNFGSSNIGIVDTDELYYLQQEEYEYIIARIEDKIGLVMSQITHGLIE